VAPRRRSGAHRVIATRHPSRRAGAVGLLVRAQPRPRRGFVLWQRLDSRAEGRQVLIAGGIGPNEGVPERSCTTQASDTDVLTHRPPKARRFAICPLVLTLAVCSAARASPGNGSSFAKPSSLHSSPSQASPSPMAISPAAAPCCSAELSPGAHSKVAWAWLRPLQGFPLSRARNHRTLGRFTGKATSPSEAVPRQSRALRSTTRPVLGRQASSRAQPQPRCGDAGPRMYGATAG
jgi:hypothetical protein